MWFAECAHSDLVQGYIHHIDHMFVSFASEYAALGFACLGFNQPGMGSPGVPGLCQEWDAYVDNAAFAAKELARRAGVEWSVQGAPSAPLFVHGQSMGGAVAIQLAMRLPRAVTGVMLSAPMCGIAPERVPNACGIGLLKCMEACCPQAQLIPQDDILADCFKCPTQLQMRREYNSKSGMPDQPRLRTGLQLYNATLSIQESAGDFAPPAVLLLQGSLDAVTDKDMTKAYIKQCSAQHRTYIEFAKCWHVIEADCMDTRQAMLHDVMFWTCAWTEAWEAANAPLVQCNAEEDTDMNGDGASKTHEDGSAAPEEVSPDDVSTAHALNADMPTEQAKWIRPQPPPGFQVTQPTHALDDTSAQFVHDEGVQFLTRSTGEGPLPQHDESGKAFLVSQQQE